MNMKNKMIMMMIFFCVVGRCGGGSGGVDENGDQDGDDRYEYMFLVMIRIAFALFHLYQYGGDYYHCDAGEMRNIVFRRGWKLLFTGLIGTLLGSWRAILGASSPGSNHMIYRLHYG